MEAKKNRTIHDPDIPPVFHNDFESYKNSNGSTINHFYEKLLLIESFMQTSAGKKLASSRTEFLRNFLERFYEEWNVSSSEKSADTDK